MAEVASGGLRKAGILKLGEAGKPLISIVIAVLNRADSIEAAIQSVLGQYYDNIELVVIDGGSTDGTVDILHKYDKQVDFWISEPDNGIYEALNKGIRAARGDWINIQGSDDRLHNTLTDIAPHLVHDHTVYYGDLLYVYQKRVNFGRLTPYQLANYRFGHHRFFFPRSYFRYYSYDTKYRICADYEMVVRSYFDDRFSFRYIPAVVASYNELDGASTHVVDYEFNRDRYSFLRKYFPLRYIAIFYMRKKITEIRSWCVGRAGKI